MTTLLFFSTFTFLAVAHYVAQPVRDIEEFANNIIASVSNNSLPNPPHMLKKNLVGPEMAEAMQKIYEITDKSQREKINLSTKGMSMQSLLRDLPAGCVIFNEKSEVSAINPLACKLLGTSLEQSAAVDIFSLIKDMRSNGEQLNFVDWLNQAKTLQIQTTSHWQNVTLKYSDTEANEESQSMFDLLASFRKLDEKSYELTLLLIDHTMDLEHQEKQMEFISLAAHELRGPITVLRGLLDIFKDEVGPNLDKDHQELMQRMRVSSRQLASYIDNILGVSKVDRDAFEVHQEAADWPELLRSSCEELQERAEARNRSLKLEMPAKLPKVAVDPAAIQHVITNLVDNAIKYSKDGGQISITVKQKENAVETTVQDFGIGIPANVVDNLFVKFYRSHRSKQAVSGSGLGLYLCKAIVEAHGGNVWVRSTEGLGSTFGFSLPTFDSVAEDLKKSDNGSVGIIRGSHGWIKNHALYRR
jgi:signal transduction histidine kinase